MEIIGFNDESLRECFHEDLCDVDGSVVTYVTSFSVDLTREQVKERIQGWIMKKARCAYDLVDIMRSDDPEKTAKSSKATDEILVRVLVDGWMSVDIPKYEIDEILA